jgi:hypothetical protein
MKRLPWAFFSSAAALLAGCEQQPVERLPIPPLDAAAPTLTDTATFALG